jgi:hypothetical protein
MCDAVTVCAVGALVRLQLGVSSTLCAYDSCKARENAASHRGDPDM